MKVKELKEILETKSNEAKINFFVDNQSHKDFEIDEINTQPLGKNYLNIIIKETNE